MDSDAALVSTAREGVLAVRHQAFERLVVRHEGLVRAMLRSLTRQPSLADDLCQEAFLTAWQKLGTLKDPTRFAPWLKQLAYRQFLHHYRHGKVEQKHLPPPIEQAYEHLGEMEDIAALLNLCTPLEAELMILCYGFEFSHAEIAESREIPVGTVKSHIFRAKKKLQQHLAPKLDKVCG